VICFWIHSKIPTKETQDVFTPPTTKEELILCLMDLTEDQEDQEGEFKDRSENWINTIDRGGLKHINNNTYMVMHAIEMC